MNIVGIYEDPHIDQADDHGDIFYLRLGMSELASHQGNVKAFIREGPQDRGKEDGMMVWEQRFGKGEDWILDDKTPRTMKFRWQEGVGYLTEFGGTELACPSNCDNKLDRLRYVVLGGDRYDNGASLVGLRFLSAKLIDLDVPEK
jgi:hypothetical protein